VAIIDGVDGKKLSWSSGRTFSVTTVFIRVFITSRAMFNIKRAFDGQSIVHCMEFDILIVEPARIDPLFRLELCIDIQLALLHGEREIGRTLEEGKLGHPVPILG